MHDNVPMAYKVFHAFNLWLEEDWGYAYKDRLYAPPYIPMLDPDLAADELEFLLNKGDQGRCRSGPGPAERPVARRPLVGPVLVAAEREQGARRVPRLRRRHEVQRGVRQDVGPVAHRPRLQRHAVAGARRPTAASSSSRVALVLGNLFGRFPNVQHRRASSSGCAWTPYALHMVDHAGLVARAPHRGVRSDDAGPAVGRVQGAHLHLAVPRGGRRRPHRAASASTACSWAPTGRTPRATSCPATSPTASRSCPRPTSRRSCATTCWSSSPGPAEPSRLTMELVDVAGPIGVEVRGVDLHQPLDDASVAILRDAFDRRHLLLFRAQEIAATSRSDCADTSGRSRRRDRRTTASSRTSTRPASCARERCRSTPTSRSRTSRCARCRCTRSSCPTAEPRRCSPTRSASSAACPPSCGRSSTTGRWSTCTTSPGRPIAGCASATFHRARRSSSDRSSASTVSSVYRS